MQTWGETMSRPHLNWLNRRQRLSEHPSRITNRSSVQPGVEIIAIESTQSLLESFAMTSGSSDSMQRAHKRTSISYRPTSRTSASILDRPSAELATRNRHHKGSFLSLSRMTEASARTTDHPIGSWPNNNSIVMDPHFTLEIFWFNQCNRIKNGMGMHPSMLNKIPKMDLQKL